MTLLLILVVAVLLAVVVLPFVARAYFKARGKRLVTCPDNRETAAVEVDARRAALTALLGGPTIRLKECSRWPQKAGCGQDCLRQIEASPGECLVKSILTKWYTDKTCVACGCDLGRIDWLERKPALLSPDGKTVDWEHLTPERIPELLATHKPVCWNCHISETFRRTHPDLAVDRPWDRSGADTNR